MTSGKDAGNPDPFPDYGSGNFDEALEAAMGATKAGQARNCLPRAHSLGGSISENERTNELAPLTRAPRPSFYREVPTSFSWVVT